MTELVTAREIPSERPLAWRLAHDARVRYVLLVGALAGAYYGAAQIGYDAEVHGCGRGDRLAAGRRRDRLPLPRRPEAVAGGGPGRPAREPVRDAPGRLCDRADDREHARGGGRRVPDPAARAERPSARQRGRSLRPARRDLRGHRGQRDDRAPLVAPRRRAVDVGPAARLAHLVARRHRGRARRRSARARLVAAARPVLDAGANRRRSSDAERGDRPHRRSRCGPTGRSSTSSFRP